jgi:phosphotransferase system enzyme I (PtsI)
VIARQFDEMEDEYLRERKADLEQVAERILRYMKGVASPVAPPPSHRRQAAAHRQQDLLLDDDSVDVPLVLVAHDLSPADMLQFKQSVFAGFVTDVGGKTSHTAIVARSMDIPAVVGARGASQLVRQDDWVIIDGDAGVVIVDPSPIILAEYGFKQRQGELERTRLARLRHTPAVTLDGQKVELLANIELPEDARRPSQGRRGRRGPVPQRVPVHGPPGQPARTRRSSTRPTARGRGHAGPAGHHPHGRHRRRQAAGQRRRARSAHLNPALGLRAIRWSLADPDMFLTQLRAILRAAAHGQVNLLIPMLAHASEIRQTLSLIDFARAELDNRGHRLRPGQARRDDRGAGGGADAAHLPEVLRLPVHRHQRPDPVHAGDRPRRRVGGPPVRPAAPGGAAPGGRHHCRMQRARARA